MGFHPNYVSCIFHRNNSYKSVGDAVGAKHKNTFKQLKSEI